MLPLKNPQPEMLVVGYGNSLRGDDGLGILAANEISTWNLMAVKCLCLHQLTPELAPELTKVPFALFLDAQSPHLGNPTRIVKLSSDFGYSQGFFGHRLEPATLVQLAKQAYGVSAESWLISIPGFDFALGERTSPEGERGLKEALVLAKNLLMELGLYGSRMGEFLHA